MTTHLLYMVLIALAGTLVLFLLKRPYLYTYEEERLREAATYTIIDITPHDEKL